MTGINKRKADPIIPGNIDIHCEIQTVLSLTTATKAKQPRLTMTDASGKVVAQQTDVVSGGVMQQSLTLKNPTLLQLTTTGMLQPDTEQLK